MKHYTTNKRYCPHLLETKLHSVELYRQTKDIEYVCRKYHISKASLMRWSKYYSLTQSYHITPSMSRRGNPYDNALAENFFSILKTECIYRTKIRTYEEARLLIGAYIHFYNYCSTNLIVNDLCAG